MQNGIDLLPDLELEECAASTSPVRVAVATLDGSVLTGTAIEMAPLEAKVRLPKPLTLGMRVRIQFECPYLQMDCGSNGIVHWCRRGNDGFLIGLWLQDILPEQLLNSIQHGTRRELRYKVDWVVSLQWQGESRREPVWVDNYSRGGLGLFTSRPAVPGDTFVISTASASGQVPIAHAEVCWQHPVQSGEYLVGCRLPGMRGAPLAESIHATQLQAAPNLQTAGSRKAI